MAALLLAVASFSATPQSLAIKREVAAKLKSIKPHNSEDYVYRVTLPKRLPRLPGSLRLDLIYKLGHYEWDLVALRFEKSRGARTVSVSQITHSSAFPFIKEVTHAKDTYSVKHGTISTTDFERLFTFANTLYHANIERRQIGPPERYRVSYSSSSSDGTILLQVTETGKSTPLISASGTLHVGDLSERVISGYENVRVHLFWEVFFDFLKSHDLFADTPPEDALNSLIARLAEPPLVNDYRDYFRQSLYVEVLGEIGNEKAVSALESTARNTRLEEDWKKYLKQDISAAIEKITARNQ